MTGQIRAAIAVIAPQKKTFTHAFRIRQPVHEVDIGPGTLLSRLPWV